MKQEELENTIKTIIVSNLALYHSKQTDFDREQFGQFVHHFTKDIMDALEKGNSHVIY